MSEPSPPAGDEQAHPHGNDEVAAPVSENDGGADPRSRADNEDGRASPEGDGGNREKEAVHEDEEDVEEDEEDEEEDEEEEDDDDEPKLKYARLTQHLGAVYRNGDATSSFLVAGDKMVYSSPRSAADVRC